MKVGQEGKTKKEELEKMEEEDEEQQQRRIMEQFCSLVAAVTAFHFDNVASSAITAAITVVAAGL